MNNRYLIIADDFTGANDTGVQMRRRGFETVVVFPGRKSAAGPTASVVIDTESRALSGREAADATAASLEGMDLGAYKYVIKKVDSTLRGNIAEEVRAVDEAFGSELIIFAPALPDLGRTTVDGVHRLRGVPITQTELAKDPRKPVTEDRLCEILGRAYAEPIKSLTLKTIRSGKISLDGARIFAADAEKNSDLQAVIAAAIASEKKVLWVGTAAIADNLMELESKTLPAFGIAASLSSTTTAQIKAAEAAGAALVKVPVHRLLSGEESIEAYVRQTVDSLASGRDTLLLGSSSYDHAELALSAAAGEKRGMKTDDVSAYIQSLLGSAARSVLSQARVSGVFLTGGDTAMGVLDAMGADGSEILSEIAIGIPMMRIIGGGLDGIKVVTKAGAFGNEDAIQFAFRRLKEQNGQ